MLQTTIEPPEAFPPCHYRQTRVLHIEDDPLAADTVRRLLERWPDYHYAAHAITGTAGIQAVQRLQPDVVLLDLGLPDVDGLEVLDALTEMEPRSRVLLLTVRCDDAFLYEVMLGHADGALTKSARMHIDLRDALLACRGGHSYLSADITGALSRFRREPTAFFKLLSNREIFLLPYFARGATDSGIAPSVGLSPATVHSHRQSITRKLDLHSSVELMRWCAEHGFAHFPRRPPQLGMLNPTAENLSDRRRTTPSCFGLGPLAQTTRKIGGSP